MFRNRRAVPSCERSVPSACITSKFRSLRIHTRFRLTIQALPCLLTYHTRGIAGQDHMGDGVILVARKI